MKDILQLIKLILLMGVLLLLGILMPSCRTSHIKAEKAELRTLQERNERLTTGQALFTLFDSLRTLVRLSADSLEMEFFVTENPCGYPDSLAATRPPRAQATGRLAARLKVSGINADTEMTRKLTSQSESTYVDTASHRRFTHQEASESKATDKEVKPPNTLRRLAFIIMAIAIAIVFAINWLKTKTFR